ncbi:MAG TPA: DegT/DnrJ/EryC1/StrS family aminotransferase [Pyrinomonadaceae bacterium]
MEELSINGGKPAKRKPFPAWPMYDETELAAVKTVIESRQWWRAIGSQVREFEQEFAKYQNAKYALAVGNGTQAIEVALAALDLAHGDEVIVPAFSFISTATAVLCVNAVPIFVDVDPDTYCLDANALAAAITPRTRAIIPVHMAGRVADMDAILDIARQHNLAVIEDAAHAHGAEWKGERAGALGHAGIFSFQAGKLMTAGEGGIILSNDEAFIERCFLFSNCGRPRTDRTYQHSVLAGNCRMSELQAAVLRAQLARLDEQIERREANAARLDRMLSEVSGLTPQSGSDPRITRDPHYMYMFRYDRTAFGDLPRQEFVDALIAEGVPSFVAYPAINRTPVFRNAAFAPRWRAGDPALPDYSAVSCPVSEEIGETVVWFHHSVLLGDEQDLREIVEAIEKIRAHATNTVGVG